MASTDSLNARFLARRGAIVVTRDDTPIVIRMRYIGATSATSVTVTAATNIVTVSNESGTTTTKTYTFATYTTMGAVVDAINADGLFEAKILDALRSDSSTNSNILNGAIVSGTDANGIVVWDALCDTDVQFQATATLSLARDFNIGKNFKLGHRVSLQEIVYYEAVNGASANSVRVYFRNGTVETQQLGFASVATTKTTINFAAGFGWITAPEGADIVVRVQDTTSLATNTSNYLQATGWYE